MEEIRTKVELALDSLRGLSPDEIAEVLQIQGVKAVCGNAYNCAIAQYVKNQLPEDTEIVVTGEVIGIGNELLPIPLSNNIRVFISNFDRAVYPKLIALDNLG
jgi:hypothetical protein